MAFVKQNNSWKNQSLMENLQEYLNKQLSETSDYDEKKKIRLALRQLRQRDKERENGRDGGKINGRGLGRSHSFASQHTSSEKNGEIVHESGDRPKVIRSSSVLESKSRSSTTENSAEPKSCETGSDVVLSRRDLHSDETKKVTTANVYSKENVSSDNYLVDRISELKSKDIVHDRKPPVVPNGFYQYSSEKTNLETPTSSLRHSVKDSHSHLQPLSFSSSRLARKPSNPDASELCQNKSSHSPLPNSPSADTPRRSRSVVEANIGKIPKVNNEKEFKSGTDIESQAKKWLEGKKRSCSLPGGDNNNLSSTLDMEAAFSELLSAVDDRVDNLSDTEVAEMDLIEEDAEEKMRSSSTASINDDDNKDDSKYDATVDKTSPSSTSVDMDVRKTNSDDEDKTKKFSRGEICISPEKSIKRPHFDSDLSPTPKEDKSAISVIEDDDGSVTVQSTTRSDLGDHTITEKLRLRRTESRTEEEEKDTIIESKETSPGGSDHYSKDVIKTRRKVTSRGSDYFTKSAYNIKKRRDFEGDEIEEQDLSVETDNFSATKGESWGDRAEAKVQVVRKANSFPTSIPEDQAVRSDSLPELAGTLTNGSSHGRMDVSKTSSGYGSVSGSDEEEKEDVTSSRRGRQAGCPEIKSPLKDVISQEGSTAVLECTVSCSPLPTVTWYKGNKPVEASRHFEPKFDSLTGKACLTVLNAGSENGGEYRCVFKNPLGQAETKSRLTVRSRALKKPVFTSPLKDMTVTEGQAVVFECKVTDATQISWYKDGIIQRNSSDFKQTFDGCFAKLEIGEIFLDDTGEYSCIAKNEKGEAKTMCKIKVKEDSGDGDVVPMFLTKPESRIYSSGDIIILECDVIGTPQPVVTWFRDGTKLSNTSKHRSLYDGRVATLKISQTVQEDSGKYEVTAKNTTGEVKVDCLIVVKAKQGPPSIMYSLSDSTATVGKPLILHCDIRGSPVPMILWRKNGRMIGNTADFKQTYENNMAKLEIKDVYEQDGGCYECVARNSFGSVSTSCNITVEGKKPSGKTTTKKTDWLVGRDNNTPEEQMAKSSNIDKLKSAGVRRSESVKVTSNYSIRDKYSRKADVKLENDGATSTHAQKSDTNNTSSTSVSSLIDRKNTESNKKSENVTEKSTGKEDPPWKNVTLRRTESAKMSNYSRSKPLTWKRDGKNENKDSDENENEQNGSENRSSTPVGWRPVSMEFKEDLPKAETEIDRLKAKSGLRRSESARAVGSNIDVVSKFIFDAQRKEKDSNVKKSEPASFEKSKSVREIDRLKDEEGIGFRHSKSKVDSNVEENNNDKKLGRSQSMRLLFESKAEPPQNVKEEPKTTTPSYLAKRNIGVRRTSSLKVTEKEAESFRSRQHENGVQLNLAPMGKEAEDSVSSRRRAWENGPNTSDMSSYDTIDCLSGKEADSVSSRRRAWENGPNTSDMSSYDTIEDEEELHKILSKTENFEERKKIRARMKEIREKKQQDWEQKRLQREKETEDVVKRKFQLAEQEKQRKMKEFDKMAVEASKERERINAKKEELLQDKIRQADLDKKRHLETFDKLARHDDVKKTVQKTPGGGTRTIIIKDSQASPVFGGITYGKSTTEQAANFLTNQLIGAVSPGTAGKITVKTESWSSKDGVTNRSEKTESWGAKPQGPQGAKSMFQQMDASAPKPNGLLSISYAKRAATTMRRNAAAIKQDILNFCKANVQEYEFFTYMILFPLSVGPAGRGGGGGGGRALMRSPSAIKQMLLEWTKAMTKEYQEYGVEVTNFSSSWNNGMAFCALIHHFYPDSFDFSKLDPKQRRKNFTLAFDTAENVADIAPLLDVDDMVKMQKPDWKCVFTYVQSFYRKLHTHERNATASKLES
ncbi:hypothetical protein FSP39_015151 [Pinctada imbricata]|uniref:Smoothelin n=1 Tax=Pinctada imbricata TaxID=66713 RepID=A0AA89BKL2_PINIB|nr:hypothetical protein FSP39_015151 [Pinctada imbricata]